MTRTRTRATADAGTPELTRDDLPGTVFLLQAEGRVREGDGLVLARCAHRRDVIDASRRKAMTPRPEAWNRLRVARTDTDEVHNDYSDPASGAEARAVETRDLVHKVLGALSPEEADLLRWRAIGTPFEEIAERVGVSMRTIEARWARLRNRARALLEV